MPTCTPEQLEKLKARLDFYREKYMKAREEVMEVMTIDELIKAGYSIYAIAKYKKFVNCSLAEAKQVIDDRKEVLGV